MPPQRSPFVAALGLAVTAALLAGCAGRKAPQAPAPPVTAQIIGAGSVVALHTGASVPAPDTTQGTVGEVDLYWIPDFATPPDEVKAQLGMSIGIEVRIEGPEFLAVVPLRTRVTHPPLTDPDTGKVTTVDEWDNPMNARFPRYTGWRFERPWELVPGTWTIEVVHEGRVIASQDFQVAIDPG